MSEASSSDTNPLPKDHPLAGVDGPVTMREALNERLSSGHVATGARADLARAMRQIIDAMMRSTADDPKMVSAAEMVGEAAALLRGPDGERTYNAVAEGSLTDGRESFIDFSPFIGELNPLAPPINVRFSEQDFVTGTVVYGAAYEGPPGCVHGGFIAAGFDEILGFAQAFSGRPGMTGNLDISYRSPTPLGSEVTYVGRLDRIDGRKIYASATLHHGTTLCAQATGLFISMKPEVFERLLEIRLSAVARTAVQPPSPSSSPS